MTDLSESQLSQSLTAVDSGALLTLANGYHARMVHTHWAAARSPGTW
ncbi:hypothetical protein [Streptomyces sp. NPDC087437]